MEYVYDISSENYLDPISFLESRYTKSDTNIVKFADVSLTTILEKYYCYPIPSHLENDDVTIYDNKHNIPLKLQNIIDSNRHLMAKNAFLSFYSINMGESELNSYYFSYDLSQTEKIIGVSEYSVDENMKSMSKIMHIRFDGNGNFISTYYNVSILDSNSMNLFLSNLSANDEEKKRVMEVINKYKIPLSIYFTRKQTGNIVIYIRELNNGNI